MNITFIGNEGKDRLDVYEEVLPYVEDWIGYSQYALKLANHIRKILGLDPYGVENDGLRVVNEVEINKETLNENEKLLEISEEVLMDLTEVTVMVMTEKAVLFTKKGYQKWVPLSTIESGVPLGEGKYLKDIELTPNGEKWIHEKSWDKLKVVKK